MIQEEIILKYLNKEASAAESAMVESWAAKNPMDFQLMEDIFVTSSTVQDIQVFDLDAEWDAFMDAVEVQEDKEEEHEATVVPMNPPVEAKTVSLWRELRPALLTASMLFIAIVAYFLYPRGEIVHLAEAQGDTITLPDNTVVSLDENAVVAYPRSFKNKEERIVKLTGIATFDITPDPDKPFIVETNLAGVRALGTIFEVDATDVAKTGVKNIEGLIRFFDVVEVEKSVDVKEGESFVYDGADFAETTPLPDPVFRTFKAPQIVTHSVREIVNYIYTISNGHAVPKGENFDWNRRIEVDLKTQDLQKLLREIQNKASVTLIKKDCSDCYEIRSFRVRN